MRAGHLSQRVEVQRLSASVNSAGQIDETTAGNWVTFAVRWCQMVTRGSREFFRGVEVAADITHQITMRADPQSKAFTVKQRLKMGDRLFNISGPPLDVDEGSEMVRFPAVEVAQDG
jgi:head-tail adaptor